MTEIEEKEPANSENISLDQPRLVRLSGIEEFGSPASFRSDSLDSNLHHDPEYEKHLDLLAKLCTCSDFKPCEGLQAGGLCDDRQYDDDYDDDEWEENW